MATATVTSHRKLYLGETLEELVKDGFLERGDANRIAAQSHTGGQTTQHPLLIIAAQQPVNLKRPDRPLDLDTLSQWLAVKADLPHKHIDPLGIDVTEVTEVMSFEFARRHQILCVEATASTVVIATAQPFSAEWVAGVEQVAQRRVERVIVNPADIDKYLVEFYTLSRSVSGARRQQQFSETGKATNVESLFELGALKNPDAQDQHIVSLVDWLLQYAFDQRASDIHLEPRRDKGRIRFRIDGLLHPVHELPAPVMTAMISRIKILGRMNVAEKRRPQDGRVKSRTPSGSEVELRLSTLPTAFGEKLVMRIFDPEVLLRSFTDLGLTGPDLARWQDMTGRPHGIVLVTGPTGSGKTTTLYSTLKQLATEEVNVSTVEDPIEMVEDAFNQTQVHPAIDLDFAAGIRTLMRQDPDIIMVGEIRDLATAEMATQAALTGHLVLSTLHTNDAPTAISRLLDLGVPAHLLRATLNGVMAQRLVRKLCEHCKEKTTIDEPLWKQLTAPWKAPLPADIWQPGGCLECRNTGYLGRLGLYEIMPLSDALRDNIKDDCDIAEVRAQARKEGMRSLRLAGALKVAAGVTSVDEVLRVTSSHES